MVEKMTNLWPDDIAGDGESTAALRILKEQAINLGNLTKNIVKAEVRNRRDLNSKNKGKLYFDFNIIAPLLQNYKYRLFQISFDIGRSYPIDIILDDDISRELGLIRGEGDNSERDQIYVRSNSDFEHALTKIFNTRTTRSIIKNLKDSSEEPDSE